MTQFYAHYKGYNLTNDEYDDAEGFIKNNWKCTSSENSFFSEDIPNTSSYTSYSDAINQFYLFVDRFIKVPVDKDGNPTSVGWMPSYEGEDPPF